MGEAEGFHGVAEGPIDGEGQDEILVVLRRDPRPSSYLIMNF